MFTCCSPIPFTFIRDTAKFREGGGSSSRWFLPNLIPAVAGKVYATQIPAKDGKYHLVKLSGDPTLHNEPKDEDTVTFRDDKLDEKRVRLNIESFLH
jgi:hypothetical protein